MKKIVIAIALFIMIGGVSVAVLKALGIDFFEESEEKQPVVEAKPVEPPRFIDMDPLVIPLFQGNRTAGTIQIQVKLETTGSANEILIHRILPKLHDVFLRDLYDYIPRMIRRYERLDIPILKARMRLMSDRIAPPGLVEDILIQSVVDNPS